MVEALAVSTFKCVCACYLDHWCVSVCMNYNLSYEQMVPQMVVLASNVCAFVNVKCCEPL